MKHNCPSLAPSLADPPVCDVVWINCAVNWPAQMNANTDGLVRLFAHLVGTDWSWDGEAKRLFSFGFGHQFVLVRSLYRQADRPLMRVLG
jgi:hypothetical protein